MILIYYVYEWYVEETEEIFYVGKGKNRRYLNVSQRNELFKLYLKNNKCNVRILKRFEDEKEALNYEHKRICELKKENQCVCNLDNGGKGGVSFVWTDEMRNYKSIYNPMKSEKQRKRMSEKNPMKNKKIANRTNSLKKRKVIIDGKLFDSLKQAGEYFHRYPTQIASWCKRGYDIYGNPCRYADEPQKELIDRKKTNSKPVIIDGKHFNSVKEGSKYIGVWSESLIKAIKNNKPCKGHICKYDNQQPS